MPFRASGLRLQRPALFYNLTKGKRTDLLKLLQLQLSVSNREFWFILFFMAAPVGPFFVVIMIVIRGSVSDFTLQEGELPQVFES